MNRFFLSLSTPLFIGFLVGACAHVPVLVPSDSDVVLAHHALTEDNPGEPGPYDVRTLYYGSGTDLQRAVYRDSVAIRTDSVDASKLVDLGDSAKERNRYWGFTPEAFPLNGRVWYPDGDGPFPLVLVVHGNHNMRDFSDPGYDYLGELLASRGYILASVDMNFINGGIRGENDGRGWMLLKHLQAWRSFDAEKDGPFEGLVDMDRIGLMGHSRGGEAVALAAAFNRLDRYPDDGSLEFDFGFNIRGVVAIAPVDGQYLPTGRPAPVTDVNYLVFHGSHDGDVTSFHGLRQYQRVTFSEDSDYFKSAVYMYRANHGQWNTVWNNKDRGPRSGRSLRLDALVTPEEQRQFARVYVSAFMDATLREDDRYLSLFRDHRVGGDWLPGTMYVTRYQHSSFQALATYEEDIDLGSGSSEGVEIAADSLTKWKEAPLALRSRNRTSTSNSQQNQAVSLAWKRDSTEFVPTYRFTLPAGLAASWNLGPTSTLDLLATVNEDVDSLATPGVALDLSLRITDSEGRAASVPLSDYGPIRKPLDIRVLRRNLDETRFGETSEVVLQNYAIPLADFSAMTTGLDLSALVEVALVFDLTPSGEVIVDDIGFASPPAGFLRHRLEAKPPAGAN
ncbi:MAG: dienelactone hydrolase [Rhodothermales bacterium]|jgi:dienelactone hydrolase